MKQLRLPDIPRSKLSSLCTGSPVKGNTQARGKDEFRRVWPHPSSQEIPGLTPRARKQHGPKSLNHQTSGAVQNAGLPASSHNSEGPRRSLRTFSSPQNVVPKAVGPGPHVPEAKSPNSRPQTLKPHIPEALRPQTSNSKASCTQSSNSN